MGPVTSMRDACLWRLRLYSCPCRSLESPEPRSADSERPTSRGVGIYPMHPSLRFLWLRITGAVGMPFSTTLSNPMGENDEGITRSIFAFHTSRVDALRKAEPTLVGITPAKPRLRTSRGPIAQIVRGDTSLLSA